ITFWFGSPGPEPGVAFQMAWFRRDDAFDEQLRVRFGDLAERALGEPAAFGAWLDARGVLGQLLLLDQLSRNLFRGSPRAFAADPRARELARDALARGLDREVPLVARTFFYLPFEHSEDLADQHLSVSLFSRLVEDTRLAHAQGQCSAQVLSDLISALDYAKKHEDVIAEFGRFPHRNAALGRISTPAESAWLAGGGF
ncbi:MAG TPA: DUF924 family protein, partial [Myxococcota bacterium]|nr:DUF924 family protein [Myxococcota bacterium]